LPELLVAGVTSLSFDLGTSIGSRSMRLGVISDETACLLVSMAA